MELRDYVRMLRRGWPTVALVLTLALGASTLYLLVAPKQYQSTATLFISSTDPRTISDLAQGVQFSGSAAATYADIADSAAVLGPVADESRPPISLRELQGMVTAVERNQTTLIDITVSGSERRQVAALANAVAISATEVIPDLERAEDGDTSVQLRVIQRAEDPTSAVSPDPSRIIGIGLIVGLCIGLAVTIVGQALDTRLHRSEDLQQVTDRPVLGILPYLSRSQRHGIVVRDQPVGRSGEAYRSLRTNISRLDTKEHNSILFASVADERDGAEIPVNLSWSIAQGGHTVLLVDMDLRHSAVGSALSLPPAEGLGDVLAGRSTMESVIQSTAQERLFVVLSGTPQISPSDLLSAPRMSELLRQVEQRYDYVVLHAPPLLTYTDAVAVSPATGWTMVNVSAGRTRARDLTAALETLGNVRVVPLGLVLAGAREPVSRRAGSRRLSQWVAKLASGR